MNSFKTAIRAAGLPALVLAFAGCEGTQPTATKGESPESGRLGVVYSEAFADSGLFTITENPLGGYNYNVEARIGSKAEKMMAASAAQPTLAGVYQAIHEGKTETPAIVSEVSDWLESQRPSGSSQERETPAPMALEKAASQSDFVNGYCRSFDDGIYVWKSITCYWKPGNNQMTTDKVNGNNVANDRVYAWNANAYPAVLELWNTNRTARLTTATGTLKPYWVTWFSWGGSYWNANVVIKLPSGIFGELGLSNHARFLR
jgi:hypothetical protein